MGSGEEPLPSTVLKILLPQTRHRGPGAISDLNHGIEPNDPSGLSNPVVQFVVLIPQEPFVVAADPVEDVVPFDHADAENIQILRLGVNWSFIAGTKPIVTRYKGNLYFPAMAYFLRNFAPSFC